jgi:ribonuclease BN (tRNA processing enzyme)
MIVKVLGTAAGVGDQTPTSSYLIDGNTLLDCGSGVETLSVENLLGIERVLLTHSHLDHCNGLPSLLDVHARRGGRGISVYTQQETIDELRAGLLDGLPDYAAQQTEHGETLLRFVAIEVGDAIPLPDGMATALPAQHSIASVGWLIEGPWRALTYTGDTALCPAFWHWSANVPSLSDIICEVSCSSDEPDRAISEGHMTPETLVPMLDLVPPNVQVWIAHMQQDARARTLDEIRRLAPSAINVGELTPDTLIDL